MKIDYNNKDTIIQYVRDNKGRIKATLLAHKIDNTVHITWSQYKKEPSNQASKAQGRAVALSRIGNNLESAKLPSMVEKYLPGFERRVSRYFDGCVLCRG